jgi:putative redox protein
MAGPSYKATIHYAGDEFFIGLPPSGNAVTIDTKGERKSAPSPLELLLVSVAACTAADVISILLKKRQDIVDYNVEVTGDRVEDHPRKFTKFHIHHIVHGRSVSERPSPTRSSCRIRRIAQSPRPCDRARRSRPVTRLLKWPQASRPVQDL